MTGSQKEQAFHSCVLHERPKRRVSGRETSWKCKSEAVVSYTCALESHVLSPLKCLSWLVVVAAGVSWSVAHTSVPGGGNGAGFFAGRTMTYVVPTGPGGGYDTYARLIGRHLERHLGGARVVIRNVPGAAHLIGVDEIYRAPADGLTIGTFTAGIALRRSRRDEPADDVDVGTMSWIGKAAAEPRVLAVGTRTPFRSIDDLRRSSRPVVTRDRRRDELRAPGGRHGGRGTRHQCAVDSRVWRGRSAARRASRAMSTACWRRRRRSARCSPPVTRAASFESAARDRLMTMCRPEEPDAGAREARAVGAHRQAGRVRPADRRAARHSGRSPGEASRCLSRDHDQRSVVPRRGGPASICRSMRSAASRLRRASARR